MTVKRVAKRFIRATADIPLARKTYRRAAHAGLLPFRAWQSLPAEGILDIHLGDGLCGFKYDARPDDVVGRYLYWAGLTSWEAPSWREFIPLAQQARGFVDIGAFTGAYTLVAAAANRNVRIMAFEPVPVTYRRLVRNVAINQFEERVTTVQAAVSEENGTAKFYVPEHGGLLPDIAFLESSARDATTIPGLWTEVETVRLADQIPDGFCVDLLKVDVEDAEGPVFEGIADVILMHRPTIFVELLPSGNWERAVAVLDDAGYDYFHLTRGGRVPVERPDPIYSLDMNYLCVPTGSRS